MILLVSLSCLSLACYRPDDYYGRGYGRGYGSGAFESRSMMMDELSVSDAQAKKIEDIDSKYRGKYDSSRGDYSRIENHRYNHRKEVMGVLNKSQKEKYNKIYADRWRRWGRGHGRNHMGYYYGHGYGMGYGAGCYEDRALISKDLGLSDKQTKKIADIDSKYRTRYYENRGHPEKIDSLRTEHRKEIEKQLTDKQKKKYSSVYNDCWQRGRGGRGWWGGHHMR